VNDLGVDVGIGETVGRVRPEWYRGRVSGSVSATASSWTVFKVGSADVDRGGGGGGPGNWTERRDSDRVGLGAGGGGGGIASEALLEGEGDRSDAGGVGKRIGTGADVGIVTVEELTSSKGVD
jgi:hypothetical protein